MIGVELQLGAECNGPEVVQLIGFYGWKETKYGNPGPGPK
jgi:hypothetical protein